VSFVAGDDGHQVGIPASENTTLPANPVTIAPGQSAQFLVKYWNTQNYDITSCQPVMARGLRIYTPGEAHSVFVAMPVTVCSSPTPPQLTTGPVEAA